MQTSMYAISYMVIQEVFVFIGVTRYIMNRLVYIG